ncbi:MAG: Mur ligase family protein [Lysobacteraceae bacterium]
MSEPTAPPFDDSRRLTGPNRHFPGPGAELEALIALGDEQIARWREALALAFAALGWRPGRCIAEPHRSGVTLAFEAPLDGLLTATEINEWACARACGGSAAHAPGHPPGWDDDSALATLRRMAAEEAEPDLLAALEAASARQLPILLDDDTLTLGYGRHGRSWPRGAPPTPKVVAEETLGVVPVALVTGSNGKTTTVRLLAALQRAAGRHVGHSCTDGVLVDGVAIETGDYSGPMGARSVLRHPEVDVAVLETARGGLLRRGLAVPRADVALVTNIAVDHFGEYGIHDLDGLARAKLSVARALDRDGCLLLNADDPTLRRIGLQREDLLGETDCAIGWFSLDPAFDWPQAGDACALRDGHLRLHCGGREHDLGAVATMPLSAQGRARYNIANLAAAALAAARLGVPVEVIRSVLARFGSDPADNPGRLERHHAGGVAILLDYAHNPDGIDGLLRIAAAERGDGRLGLLLGQAGNREDRDIRALAAAAARYRPDRIVLKDLDGYMRGRAEGEVPAVLRAELLALGLPATALVDGGKEMAATRAALSWARPGDLLVLPVHTLDVRHDVLALFERLRELGWRAGTPLPD